MSECRAGDEVTASTHRSRIYVVSENDRGVILGRRINKDGKPGRRKLSVLAENVASVRLKLLEDDGLRRQP